MRKYILTGLAAFAFVSGGTIAAARYQQPTGSNEIVVAMPAEWIPFSANFHMVDHHGETTGTFHRRRDGSMAWILETPGGPATTIHNLTTRQTYVKVNGHDWVAYLLDGKAKVRPVPELRLSKNQVVVVNDSSLGDVYDLTNPKTGQVTRIAPGLNGEIINVRQPDGTGLELGDVRLGDPPDSVFLPPPGLRVDQVSREIAQKPNKPPAH